MSENKEPITIEARGSRQKITMEEIEGKQCICVSSSFRAVQLAFSKLWRENEGIAKSEANFLTFSEDELFSGEMAE